MSEKEVERKDTLNVVCVITLKNGGTPNQIEVMNALLPFVEIKTYGSSVSMAKAFYTDPVLVQRMRNRISNRRSNIGNVLMFDKATSSFILRCKVRRNTKE